MKIQRKLHIFLAMITIMHHAWAVVPNSVVDVVENAVVDYNFNQPVFMAITPDGTIGYVINNAGFINVVDMATNVVTGIVIDAEVTTFNQPISMAITPDGTKAYVANDGGNSVSIVDITTNMVTGFLTGFDNPVAVAIAADGATAYVVNYGGGSVSMIDVATDTFIGLVGDEVDSFDAPTAIAITPDGTKAYVANDGYLSFVVIIDLVKSSMSYNTVIGVVTDTDHTMDSPTAIAITLDGTIAYVTNQNNNTVTIINVATDTVIGTVRDCTLIPTFNTPKAIALAANGKTGYVANYAGNIISIFDVATNKVTGTIVDNTLNRPNFILITKNGQTGYVTDFNSNDVSIIFINSVITTPISLKIRSVVDNFINHTARFNILTWTPAVNGIQAIKYLIYRDAGLAQYVGSVQVKDRLEYIDYNRQANTTYTYYVVAVDVNGNVSQPVSATITTEGK